MHIVISVQLNVPKTKSIACMARTSLGVAQFWRIASDSLPKLNYKYWLHNLTKNTPSSLLSYIKHQEEYIKHSRLMLVTNLHQFN